MRAPSSLLVALVAAWTAAGCQSEPGAPRPLGRVALSAEERAAMPGEIEFASEEHGRNRIRAIRPSGDGLRDVLAAENTDHYPSQVPGIAVAVSEQDGEHREQIAAVDGTFAKPVGPWAGRARNPSAARHGLFVVFEASMHGFSELYRHDFVGHTLTRLTFHPAGSFEPAVSPDGARIAFASSRDGNAELYLMDARGGQAQRLTFAEADDWSPSFAPGGDKIAFLSDRTGHARMHLMNTDGTEQQPLERGGQSQAEQRELRWSPDGEHIAYVESSPGQDTSAWLLHVASGDRVRLSPPDFTAHNAEFDPGGRYLVLSCSSQQGTHLYLVRADGSGFTQLTQGGAIHWLPRWRAL